MKLEFIVTSKLQVEATPTSTIFSSAHFTLKIPSILDQNRYIDKNGVYTLAGTQVITNTLVQALIGNIHVAHENKVWDSAAHLRKVIQELEDGFIRIPEITLTNE